MGIALELIAFGALWYRLSSRGGERARAEVLAQALLVDLLLTQLLVLALLGLGWRTALGACAAKAAMALALALWPGGVRRHPRRADWATLVLFLLALAPLAWLWGRHHPLGWDSYSYHLPVALNILRYGPLAHLEYYGFSIGSYFPCGIELLWALRLGGGGIEGSAIVALPGLVLAALGLWLVLRTSLGVRRPLAALAIVWLLTLPVVRRYWFEAYVDGYFAGFFALVCHFVIRWARERRFADLGWALLAAALLANAKYQGLPILAALGGLWALLWLVRLARGGTAPGRALAQVLVVALALVPLGMTLARNALNTGNPLFPIRIDLPLLGELPGHFSAAELARRTSLAANWERFQLGDLSAALRADLGPSGMVAAGLLALAALAGPLMRRRSGAWRPALALGAACALAALLFGQLPFSGLDTEGDPNLGLRLALPVLALLLFAGVFALDAIRRAAVPISLLALCIAGNLHGAGIASFRGVLARQRWQEVAIPEPYAHLPLAYCGENRHFQLYDRGLRRILHYVPTGRIWGQRWNRERDLAYHKRSGDFELWLRNLLASGSRAIILLGDCLEARWIHAHPRLFEPLREDLYGLRIEAMHAHLGS